jgi:hypothetical protein
MIRELLSHSVLRKTFDRFQSDNKLTASQLENLLQDVQHYDKPLAKSVASAMIAKYAAAEHKEWIDVYEFERMMVSHGCCCIVVVCIVCLVLCFRILGFHCG